jgi:hypothetical protein
VREVLLKLPDCPQNSESEWNAELFRDLVVGQSSKPDIASLDRHGLRHMLGEQPITINQK